MYLDDFEFDNDLEIHEIDYTKNRELRLLRRKCRIAKKKRRIDIITMGSGYNPYKGYLDLKYYQNGADMTGAYIKYIGSSKSRKYAKNQTSRRTRREKNNEYLGKGNRYRKNFDFWWYIT